MLLLCLMPLGIFSQITEMKWELDYEVFFKLSNDSTYSYDIREAFHVKNVKDEFTSDFVFYPVNPGEQFAREVPVQSEENPKYSTLWSALHAKIGGGWVHFSNCIAYAIETGELNLSAPLMKRPESDWKPKPMTDSYKRTKKWLYYVPVSQKNAQKEYQARLKSGDVGDLNSLPSSYVDLLLNTPQNDYDLLKRSGKKDIVAKIDLVKVILGANYLGEAQITYISNAILKSVLAYSSNMLPSVIIFDEFEAAAAMSLNAEGYKIEEVVYRAAADISEIEAKQRREQIEQIVEQINEYNKNSFKKRLGSYYEN